MTMLAEMVTHVIGVDPDRDRITAVIIDATTRGELDQLTAPTTPTGYQSVIDWANDHTTPTERVWSIEGAGCYGSGLCVTLQTQGEWVVEFDRPEARTTKDSAKTGASDLGGV